MQKKTDILIVDDDKEMGNLLKDYLGKHGYQVTSLTSASQALRWFSDLPQEYLPQLVFSDVKMGPTSGIDLVKQLNASHPGLPVVLFSVFGSKELEKEALLSGAVKFMQKPFPLAEINKVVNQVRKRS